MTFSDMEARVRAIAATWGRFVQTQRTRRNLTVRGLARAAQVAPSYVRKVEADGSIPSRKIVVRLAVALEVQPDIALLAAGYAPMTGQIMRAVLEIVDALGGPGAAATTTTANAPGVATA